MNLYYVTLNTAEEAQKIGHDLLHKQFAVCVNWFPITCAYRWQDEITQESEVVLMVKTRSEYRAEIEETIRQHITYTNFIAEITPTKVNQGFLDWLNAEVPVKAHQTPI